MTVVDANLLIYAYDGGSPFHGDARLWLEGTFNQQVVLGLPLQSVTAFLRLITGTLRERSAMTDGQAIAVVHGWLGWPNVHLLVPGAKHWSILAELLQQHRITGKLIADAQIAAIALEFGGVVATADRDFDRFSGVPVEYPLRRQ